MDVIAAVIGSIALVLGIIALVDDPMMKERYKHFIHRSTDGHSRGYD